MWRDEFGHHAIFAFIIGQKFNKHFVDLTIVLKPRLFEHIWQLEFVDADDHYLKDPADISMKCGEVIFVLAQSLFTKIIELDED